MPLIALPQIESHVACVPSHALLIADTNPPEELPAQAACAIASASYAFQKKCLIKRQFEESFVNRINMDNFLIMKGTLKRKI